MLGKQWLNRYASVDMRGSAIERSQNRQRKLDGVVTWYFDHVMELLPLILQVALLLLGCALSQYLWGINTTIASVVLGVTVFGVIFYVFIVVAGAVFVSCPYQTPVAQILRYLWSKVPVRSAFFTTKRSTPQDPEMRPDSEQTSGWEVTALDFRCISWMLQTSLDRYINELTFKFLGSILTLPGLEDVIVADCFNMLIGCVSIMDDGLVVATRGSEQLAEMAATCLLGAVSHMLIMEPASNILRDVSQRYKRGFLRTVDLRGLPFYPTIAVIHGLITGAPPSGPDWNIADPSTPENLSLVHNLVKIAWYQKFGLERWNRVVHWILRFSLHSLLQDPEPPVSVIADCLLIIAIDLGYNPPKDRVMSLDKRYVRVTQLCGLSFSPLVSASLAEIVSEISSQLRRIDRNPRRTDDSDRQVVTTLFLWATRLELVDEFHRFHGETHNILHRILDLSDRVHLSDPGLAVIYLDALLGCIEVNDDRVTECLGSERAARAASICLLRALSVLDRQAMVDHDIIGRYVSVIPSNAKFEGRLCPHTMSVIHMLLTKGQGPWPNWVDYRPRPPEHVFFANALVQIVRPRVSPVSKVPRRILRFVLHSLSQATPPSAPLITACLSIVAIDLGCYKFNTDVTALDERYVGT